MNNVLLDNQTGEGICVIDLDTVMPGSLLQDTGDLIRSMTSSAGEDRTATEVDVDRRLFAAIMEGYFAFGAAGEEAGVVLGGDALLPTPTATSVQVRDGETITIDGPFAETKEQLGGYYLLDCETLDEAIAWAARIPHAALGTVEVRPIIEFEQG